jgi:hypothetical protein
MFYEYLPNVLRKFIGFFYTQRPSAFLLKYRRREAALAVEHAMTRVQALFRISVKSSRLCMNAVMTLLAQTLQT